MYRPASTTLCPRYYYTSHSLVTVFIMAVASDIKLNSNQSKEELCFGDQITFICSVRPSRVLQWAVESVNTFFHDPIQFDRNAEDGHVLVPDPFPEVINVTLLTSGMSTGDNISSQITVLVNAKTLRKRVYCSDSITNVSIVIIGPSKFVMLYSNDVESAVHLPTGEPSQPDIFIYNFTHGIGRFSDIEVDCYKFFCCLLHHHSLL